MERSLSHFLCSKPKGAQMKFSDGICTTSHLISVSSYSYSISALINSPDSSEYNHGSEIPPASFNMCSISL